MDPTQNDDDRVGTIQRLWSDGDYRRIGELFASVSEQLVAELDARLDLGGKQVLDAATGTGNTALELARVGANVHAFDLTPRLLAIARERAELAGLDVELVDGDLLAIPYPEGSFDVVVSTFGAFTVDDHQRCMAELVRVARPGGMVVTTAWADEGCLATLRHAAFERYPQLADPSAPDPRAWSREDGLREMLAGLPATLELERRQHGLLFPSTAAAMTLLEEASGPVQRLRDGVAQVGGDWADLCSEIRQRWDHEAEIVDDGVVLTSTYVVARIAVAG